MLRPSTLLPFIAGVAGVAITAAIYECHIHSWFVQPGFCIDTAPLLRRRCALIRFSRQRYDVICLDIDKMKLLNSGPTAYDLTNALIRGAFADFRMRVTDGPLAIGQFLEGDEMIIPVVRSGEGAGLAVAQRLQQCFAAQPIPADEQARLAAAGIACLSATMTVIEDVPADKIMVAAARGMSATAARKRGGERGTIRAVSWNSKEGV